MLEYRQGEIERGKQELPNELSLLLPRERELAQIVYESGPSTAAEVQSSLSNRIGNSAIRSMLNRLVAKGVLCRHKVGLKFLYTAAISGERSRLQAVRRFVDDFFMGSESAAATTMARLLEEDARRSLARHEPR